MEYKITAYRDTVSLDDQEKALLAGLKGNCTDRSLWAVYSDFLKDQGRLFEAALAEQKAHRCKVAYAIKHVPSGKVWRGVASYKTIVRQAHWVIERTNRHLPKTREAEYVEWYGAYPVKLEDLQIIMIVSRQEIIGAEPLPAKEP